ncbi:TIGR00269 family protein [Candidatus Micrarchaeota archaeon]|nr:TIGR00269 family protein [Candidatus Micrarchaeota archaeon]
MECECGRKAVIETRYNRKKLCDRCFVEMYEKRVWRTIRYNSLLEKSDRILVGVSGGKDSLAVLHFLAQNHFDVTAITLDEGIAGYREKTLDAVEDYCQQNSIPLIVVPFKEAYGSTVDEAVRKGEHPCSVCGVFRRDLLNSKASELGFTKVATGHNLDDEVQAMLMNLLRSELPRLARCAPGFEEVDGFVPRVKPLRECPERENIAYAFLNKLPYSDAECPYSKSGFRAAVRDALNGIEEKHPGSKQALLKNFDELTTILRKEYAGKPFRTCARCGGPCAGDTCKACEFREKLGEPISLLG